MAKGRRKKTAATTAGSKVPAKIPQRHGGALYAGGVVGNRGGPGSTPSVLRQTARESLAKRLKVLELVADGEPIQKIRLNLLAILPHMKCNLCGAGNLVPADPENAENITIEAQVSASPRDRTGAVKVLAEVGMTTSRLDVEDVRGRLSRTLETISATLPVALANGLIERLKPIWMAP